MGNLSVKLNNLLKSGLIDEEKFQRAVLPLLRQLSSEESHPSDQTNAAKRIVTLYKVKVAAEQAAGMTTVQTYNSFNLIIHHLFEILKPDKGEILKPHKGLSDLRIVDISDSSNLLEEEVREIMPEITTAQRIYKLKPAACRFESKVAAMWGRLEEQWLVQEGGVGTRENIARLRKQLKSRSGTTEGGDVKD